MARWILAITACLAVALSLSAFAADEKDPTLDALQQAKEAYVHAAVAARDDLIDAFDEATKATAQTGNLDGVKELTAALDAFKKDGTLPTTPRLRTATAAYQRALRTAHTTLERAYDQTIRALTRELRIEEAEHVRKEWEKLRDISAQQLALAPDRAAAAKPTPAIAPGKVRYTFHEVKQGDQPKRLIHKNEGFCYIVGIHGGFNGGGEWVQLSIEDDGYWWVKLAGQTDTMNIRIVAVHLD